LDNHYKRIQSLYKDSQGHSTGLFQGILSVAEEIGLDQALVNAHMKLEIEAKSKRIYTSLTVKYRPIYFLASNSQALYPI